VVHGQVDIHAGVEIQREETRRRARVLWRCSEQLEKAHEKHRRRLMREQLECALRLEAPDRLMTDLKIDPEEFRRLWIQPLLAAGTTLTVALACIAQSHFQPN